LAYYFCPLRLPSGAGPVKVSGIDDLECAGMGILKHSSMRSAPYHAVWSFFEHLTPLIQPPSQR
jgi:hypothetical protein